MISSAVISDPSVEALSSAALAFPDGLVGCQDWKNFVLLSDDEESLPVACLQSVDQPQISLLVTDPRLIDAGYSVSLSAEDSANLDLQASDEPVLYCTLSVGRDGQITANLLGPLVINPRTRRGRQIVLSDSSYSTRYPVAQLDN
jgi:flagellar assembly factor FliW